MNIKNLHAKFVERLDKVMESKLSVVVGDADGADKSIQQALIDKNYSSVTVFCTGAQPRNNVGNWPVKSVQSSAEEGTRAYFTAKDVEMAKVADYGLMIWDTKSTGTLSNVIELIRGKKKAVVFINKEKSFLNVSDFRTFNMLISTMSEAARTKADAKIGLSRTLSRMDDTQLGLKL